MAKRFLWIKFYFPRNHLMISGGIEVGQILWRSLKETTHYYAGSDFISLSDLITELLKNT